MGNEESFLEKQKVIEWFGNVKHYIEAHTGELTLNSISQFIIE